MPRIQVVTSIHNQQHHKRIAAAITSVFTEDGMSAEHVSTEFYPIQSTLVYAGRESLDEILGKRDFALLRIYVSTRRGEEFRDEFVAAMVRVFDGLGVEPAQVAIDFVPREAADAYIGTVHLSATRMPLMPPAPSASLTDPDTLKHSDTSPTLSPTDEAVRDLLARFWGDHLPTAAPETKLLDLVPDPLRWNSLAKAEIATNLETWLGLPFNTLDVGSEQVKRMFGDAVTLGDLITELTNLAERAA
jgi:hypothetical protein